MSQSEYMKEVERLAHAYADAKLVRYGMNSTDPLSADPEQAFSELIAHIQRGAVPEGYDIAPTFRGYAKLGIGQYVLHNCPRTDEDHPSLVIAIATEEEKAGRQVGELRQSQPGLMIQPERIAVRIDFKSVAALDALEQQLRFLREDSFPDCAAPVTSEVPMPEPKPDRVTQIGHGPRIYSHSPQQFKKWGESCRAAGYVAGVKAENARCKQILTDKREHYVALPDRALEAQCFDHAQILLGGWAYEAALRGEEK